VELPQPKGSITNLLQDVVINFVGATKLVIDILRRGLGKA
jgi:hypothetical protein